MKEEPNVSNQDIEYFTQGLNFTPPDTIQSKTVGDVIESQKERIRNSNFQRAAQGAKKTQMYMHHHFKFAGMNTNDQEEADFNQIVYEVTNLGDKTITDIQGQIRFFSQKNDIIKIFNINMNKNIEPGETIRNAENFVHDPENNRDRIIRDNLKNLRGKWEPITITFEGGEKLTLAD
ncbi:MAG: hypothetical protein ACOCZW_00630 [Bacteroidota bacterium]